MPDLPDRKVGIVACSGEELAEGTVSRLAALKVLQELRPRDTVTICLPLFLAGGQGDRAFARFHPTITIDGCELRCAARATEMHSGKPTASIVVNDLISERGLARPEGRRRLNEAGKQAVGLTAERLVTLVDKILENDSLRNRAVLVPQGEPVQATCSCGSGIPITTLEINGKAVELVALPMILQQFQQASRPPDDAVAREILEAVKIYNSVPSDAEVAYREAVLAEYTRFWRPEDRR